MRFADCNVPLHSDSQCHVDGGTEGHGRHRVQHVDVGLEGCDQCPAQFVETYPGEDLGDCEPSVDHCEGGVCVDRNIEDNVPEKWLNF